MNTLPLDVVMVSLGVVAGVVLVFIVQAPIKPPLHLPQIKSSFALGVFGERRQVGLTAANEPVSKLQCAR